MLHSTFHSEVPASTCVPCCIALQRHPYLLVCRERKVGDVWVPLAAFAGVKTIAKHPLSWPKKIKPKVKRAASRVSSPHLHLKHHMSQYYQRDAPLLLQLKARESARQQFQLVICLVLHHMCSWPSAQTSCQAPTLKSLQTQACR